MQRVRQPANRAAKLAMFTAIMLALTLTFAIKIKPQTKPQPVNPDDVVWTPEEYEEYRRIHMMRIMPHLRS